MVLLLGSAVAAQESSLSSRALHFTALDGSLEDSDGVANGVWSHAGELILEQNLGCGDVDPEAGCRMTLKVHGNLVLRPGSSIEASDGLRLDVAGDLVIGAGVLVAAERGIVEISASGRIEIDGVVLASPPGVNSRWGGDRERPPVLIESRGGPGYGLRVGPTGMVLSATGSRGDAGVELSGCGVQILGMVAASSKGGEARVRVHSCEDLLIDGRDLRPELAAGPRLGRIAASGGDRSEIDLLARRAIQLDGAELRATGRISARSEAGSLSWRRGRGSVEQTESLGGDAETTTGARIALGACRGLTLDGTLLTPSHEVETIDSCKSQPVRGRTGPGDRPEEQLQASPSSVAPEMIVASAGMGGTCIPDLVLSGQTISTTEEFLSCGALTATDFHVEAPGVVTFVATDSIALGGDFTVGSSSTFTAAIDPTLNQPPVAKDDAFSVNEDGLLMDDVLADNGNGPDSDPDADPLSINTTPVSGPAHGDLTLSSNGQFEYEPDPNFNGADSFEYELLDGNGGTAVAEVTVTVTSVNDLPVGLPDSFDFVGNTLLLVDRLSTGGAEILVVTTLGTGVLDNDSDPVEMSPISVVAVKTGAISCPDGVAPFTDCPTANGGTVTMESSGQFSYAPKAGDTAPSDSFEYALSDGSDTVDVSVTLQRKNRVWYVENDNMSGTDDGRSTDPFDTLVEAEAASVAGDTIYVLTGDGTSTGQAGGFSIKEGQRLFGEGVDLTVPDTVNGVTEPVLFDSLANNHPVITNTAGTGIEAHDVSAEIRGVRVTGLATGIDIAVTAGVSEVTVSDSIIKGTTSGHGIEIASSDTGSLELVFDRNQVESGDTAAQALAGASFVGASFTPGAGSLVVTSFSNNTVPPTMGAVGPGIRTELVVFDADTSLTGEQHVNGQTLIVGDSSGLQRTNGAGLTLFNVKGDLRFDVIDIYNGGQQGLLVSNLSQPSSDFALTIDDAATTSRIDTVNGSALDLNRITVDATLASVSTSGNFFDFAVFLSVDGTGAANGVDIKGGSLGGATATTVGLASCLGTFVFGGPITNSAGASVAIFGFRGGSVDFDGDINDTGGGVRITSSDAGTVRFDGQVTLNTGTAAGVEIATTQPTGPTVHFAGGLDIDTTTGAGFMASDTVTGATTVNVTGANNTIDVGAALAVDISKSTIGTSGMTFKSVSSNGGAKGIRLDAAGHGGFTVTGTGTTSGSGGTIQNKTARGIEIIGTDNVSFSNVTLTNASTLNGADPTNPLSTCSAEDNSGCNAAIHLDDVTNAAFTNVAISGTTAQQGINGRLVTGFTLANSTISGAGDQVNEGGVRLFDLAGTLGITGTKVEFSSERNLLVKNDFASPTTLTMTVSGSELNDTQSSGVGADGLEIDLDGSSRAEIDILNNMFKRNRTNGIQVLAQGSSEVTSLDITGNSIDPFTGIGKAIDVAADDSATVNFNILSNPKLYSDGGTAVNVAAFANSVVNGRINSNTDVQTDRTAGGAAGGSGIVVKAEEQASVVVEINGNGISNVFQDNGIQVLSRSGLGGTAGGIDATVNNNTVTLQGSGAVPLYGIEVRAQNDNTTCANVSSNTITLGNGVAVFRERTSDAGSTVELQGFNTDAATTWSNNGNSPAGPVSDSNNGTLTGGTCTTPSHPL